MELINKILESISYNPLIVLIIMLALLLLW